MSSSKKPLEGKKVSDSSVIDQTYKVFPNDLNSNGTIFGGTLMAIVDRIAAVVAERHSRELSVTASVDAMHFLAPAHRGDVLLFTAAVNRTWNTSMEIGIRVVSENYRTGELNHILSAYFTFVAVDKEGKPTQVPPLLPETPLERRRYEEADLRRRQRKFAAEERRQMREKQEDT
jgi:acyl-CoA hydrolase